MEDEIDVHEFQRAVHRGSNSSSSDVLAPRTSQSGNVVGLDQSARDIIGVDNLAAIDDEKKKSFSEAAAETKESAKDAAFATKETVKHVGETISIGASTVYEGTKEKVSDIADSTVDLAVTAKDKTVDAGITAGHTVADVASAAKHLAEDAFHKTTDLLYSAEHKVVDMASNILHRAKDLVFTSEDTVKEAEDKTREAAGDVSQSIDNTLPTSSSTIDTTTTTTTRTSDFPSTSLSTTTTTPPHHHIGFKDLIFPTNDTSMTANKHLAGMDTGPEPTSYSEEETSKPSTTEKVSQVVHDTSESIKEKISKWTSPSPPATTVKNPNIITTDRSYEGTDFATGETQTVPVTDIHAGLGPKETTMEKISTATTAAKDTVKEKATTISNKASDMATAAKDTVKDTATKVYDEAAYLTTAAKDTVKDTASTFSNKASDLTTAAKETAKDTASTISNKASDIASGTKAAVHDLTDKAAKLAIDTKDTVKEKVDEWTTPLFGSTPTTTKDTMKTSSTLSSSSTSPTTLQSSSTSTTISAPLLKTEASAVDTSPQPPLASLHNKLSSDKTASSNDKNLVLGGLNTETYKSTGVIEREVVSPPTTTTTYASILSHNVPPETAAKAAKLAEDAKDLVNDTLADRSARTTTTQSSDLSHSERKPFTASIDENKHPSKFSLADNFNPFTTSSDTTSGNKDPVDKLKEGQSGLMQKGTEFMESMRTGGSLGTMMAGSMVEQYIPDSVQEGGLKVAQKLSDASETIREYVHPSGYGKNTAQNLLGTYALKNIINEASPKTASDINYKSSISGGEGNVKAADTTEPATTYSDNKDTASMNNNNLSSLNPFSNENDVSSTRRNIEPDTSTNQSTQSNDQTSDITRTERTPFTASVDEDKHPSKFITSLKEDTNPFSKKMDADTKKNEKKNDDVAESKNSESDDANKKSTKKRVEEIKSIDPKSKTANPDAQYPVVPGDVDPLTGNAGQGSDEERRSKLHERALDDVNQRVQPGISISRDTVKLTGSDVMQHEEHGKPHKY